MVKPNVICVGFAKCGTTTLYSIMNQHKDIFLSGIKEPLYYSSPKLYSKGFEWYQKRYYPKKVKEKIIMEINPRMVKSINANKVLKDFGKNTKIIFIIRNPIERAYSHFKMILKTGLSFPKKEDNLGTSTNEKFHRWIQMYYDDNQNKIKECNKTYFITSNNYYKVIKDYMDTFGSENVKTFIFEDFIKNPQKTCKEIYRFIDIEDDETINYNIHSNEGNRLPINKLTIKINRIFFKFIYKRIMIEKLPYISNTFCSIIDKLSWFIPTICSKKDKSPQKILPEDYELLRNYYYKDTKKLCKLLNVDLIKKWKME